MKVHWASSQKMIDVRIRDTKKLKGEDFDQQGFINDIYLKDEVFEKLVKRVENEKGESAQKEKELKNLKGQMQNAQGTNWNEESWTNFFKYLK